jgi:parallel beta-helix repeat protein
MSLFIENVGQFDQAECTVTVRPGDSIQTAIDAAPEGAVICLTEGTWQENLTIMKKLIIRGAGWNKTVIKGGITIHEEATIEGIAVVESSMHGITVGVGASVLIQKNLITKNHGYGISVCSEARAMIIENIISNNGDGINITDGSQAFIQKKCNLR